MSVAIGFALRVALAPFLGWTVPYITFFPAVMFAAWFGGLGPGILATILSLGAALYWAIPPTRFALESPADLVGAIVFVAVAVFISILNEALRRARARSEQRLEELTLETAQRSRVEQALAESKREAEESRDLLQTTLASIGDAVIVTDTEGRVTFLNAVAQELSGWSDTEAAGKANSEVFVIRNEKTHGLVENPIEKALREGVIVGLANHTVLIGRNGREIPIEDSAAPIRNKQGQILGIVLVFRDVSRRRKAETARERSEERLRLALDAGQIGVWDWDVAQNQIEWSDLVYDLHGVPRGMFPGKVEDFAHLIHPGDRDRISEAITAALRENVPYDVEFRVIHPDGSVHWLSTTAVVFRNEKGEPVRMLGATNDITARKEAEANLLQQWRTFDTALSHTPDFTYTFDLAGRFTYVNRSLLSLWQLPLEQARGKNFFELQYPPDLAARLQRQIQEVIATQQPIRDTTPFTGPTGETRHYEYIFVPVFGAAGLVEAVAGSTRDITERKQAEEALRTSEERLTLALEAGGGVGTWDWDVPGDRVHINPQFAKLFSIDAERAADGAPLADFMQHIHPDDRVRNERSVRDAVETGGDYAEEYRVLQQNGTVRWVFARGRCNADPSGRAIRFPGVVFDITERKEAEDALRRANRELEEFAYVASHDLQEPLRMVNIYTQLILRDLGVTGTKLNQYAGFVQQGVNRMESLIQDLLTFSRTVHTDELPIGKADLSAAFTEAMSVLKNRMEESASVITAGPLPVVRGDTAQMAHVFQNILSNSLKYRKKDLPANVQVSAVQDGSFWNVSIRDNGIGFEPQYSERIFGLFKRLHKEEYPGTGLGLAICQRIVERFGGRMWAEGKPGEGAAFHFSLPRWDGD